MGLMQRRKRIAREYLGKARVSVMLRSRTWSTAEEFEAEAPDRLTGKQYAEKLADAGMFVWYDAAENVMKARKVYGA